MFINYAIILRWVLGWLTSALGSTAITTTGAVATGALTVTGALAASGNFAIATNKFTVTAASGNTLVAGTLAVTGASTLTGALTPTGGIAPTSAPTGVCNWPNVTATSGTDTALASGTQLVTAIFVPCNMTITNINMLIGSVGGTDKVYAVLYDSTGAVLGNTDITVSGTNVTVGTAAQIQTIPLTTPLPVVGPRRFFIGVSFNGATARLRTVPAFCQQGLLAGQVAQTHGTVAAITPPATFTADKGPVVFVN